MHPISWKISFEKKAKIWFGNFFRSDEIKTPRCQDNYLRLTEGRLNLPPYNNSTNMPTRMVSNSAWFYVGKRLSLSTSAVQTVFKRNKRKFQSHNVTSAVKCRRHHHLSWVRLPKLPGPERRKGKAKGKHIEICEEAATCSAEDLRENILSEMRAIGQKINFLITGDKFRSFLDMPSFAPSWFFDTSGFVEMLWNLNGWIVFRRSCYEKRAGSRSLSHWQVRSQEAQVIPQRSIFSLSLSFTDMIEATL